MALTVNSYCAIKATISGTVAFGTQQYIDDSDASPVIFADGSGSGQANKLYESKDRSLSASSSENLDLAGSLTDPNGTTLTFTAIKGIWIGASSSNTNDVVIGNASSNAFVGPFGGATHTVAIRPGGKVLFEAPATGWTVTAGTGDILKVLNGGGSTSVTYSIKIWGIG